LDDSLMIRDLPGVFVAGEMIDWDAPTGGYLMQGCFATGTRAGSAAAGWVSNHMITEEAVGRRRSEPHIA
jgi:predicted flavoprotein YhiN